MASEDDSVLWPDPARRYSLHVHTWRCRHATGAPVDYCAEAARNGVEEMAFTDHVPYPDHLWEQGIRMPIEELDDYFEDVRMAQKAYPQMVIHSSLECEYRPELGSWTKETLIDVPNRCEFLILGMHSYITRNGDWHSSWRIHDDAEIVDYTRFEIRAMETGWFRFVAHPELFAHAGCAFTPTAKACCRDIIEAAVALKMPLEINANGLRKGLVTDDGGSQRFHYPWTPFWRMAADLGATIIVNADAHHPQEIWDQAVMNAYEFRRKILTEGGSGMHSAPGVGK